YGLRKSAPRSAAGTAHSRVTAGSCCSPSALRPSSPLLRACVQRVSSRSCSAPTGPGEAAAAKRIRAPREAVQRRPTRRLAEDPESASACPRSGCSPAPGATRGPTAAREMGESCSSVPSHAAERGARPGAAGSAAPRLGAGCWRTDLAAVPSAPPLPALRASEGPHRRKVRQDRPLRRRQRLLQAGLRYVGRDCLAAASEFYSAREPARKRGRPDSVETLIIPPRRLRDSGIEALEEMVNLLQFLRFSQAPVWGGRPPFSTSPRGSSFAVWLLLYTPRNEKTRDNPVGS
ncbi:hypothetical protein P7K49_033972, partial [Saguinus oedipus]